VPVGSEVADRTALAPVASSVPAWPNQPNGDARRASQPGQDGGARPGSASPGADGSSGGGGPSQEPPPRIARSADAGAGANPPNPPPAEPSEPAPDADALSASASADDDADGTDGDDGSASAIELKFSGVEFIEEHAGRGWLAGFGGGLFYFLSRIGTELVTVLVRDPLEAIAIVLLGLGGAVFPPVWLAGALVALFSRKWDHRDKWLGLAVPVLLVVFGAMLVVVLGGQRQSLGGYAMEFWLAAGRLSRLAAVLGASYLLSRVIKYQGKPRRRQPPWSQPAARR